MTGIVLPYRGTWPQLAPDCYVAPTACIIGDVTIGAGSSVWFGTVLRGDINRLRIGARTNIQDGTVVHVNSGTAGVTIGDDVTIGHMAIIHDCTLHDRAFVGMQACVMDGAVVETDAMVAAGALLTPGKQVRRGELWAGRPAKLMRVMSAEEIAANAHAAVRYAELARIYRAEASARAGSGAD